MEKPLNRVALYTACKDVFVPEHFAKTFFIKQQYTGKIVYSPKALREAIENKNVTMVKVGRRNMINLWDCLINCNIW